MDFFVQLGLTVIVAVFTAGGVYIGVRKDLDYLRRDVDSNRESIRELYKLHRH